VAAWVFFPPQITLLLRLLSNLPPLLCSSNVANPDHGWPPPFYQSPCVRFHLLVHFSAFCLISPFLIPRNCQEYQQLFFFFPIFLPFDGFISSSSFPFYVFVRFLLKMSLSSGLLPVHSNWFFFPLFPLVVKIPRLPPLHLLLNRFFFSIFQGENPPRSSSPFDPPFA